MAVSSHQYECILFGATGYTGKWIAECITTHLPTDFKWAVAGRSESKLLTLVHELKAINADRLQPGVESAQLEKDDILRLVKKTKVLITSVGPYHKYGEIVLQACAETGTHYLDVTGEVPWVYEMIQKCHQIAKKTGAIIIPQNGVESAPTDLMCWKMASVIREKLGLGTAELVHTVYEMNISASGGTLATLLSLFETYSLSELAKTQNPWCLSPIASPKQDMKSPLIEKITGVRTVSGLGTLTDSIQGSTDKPIAHRSWGLYGEKLYGKNFHVSAYMRTRNALTGFGVHLGLIIAFIAFNLPPFRWLVKQFVYSAGDGPSKEQARKEYVEWRALANADVTTGDQPKQAYGRMRWDSSMYHLTGVTSSVAALILAREKTYANELGGGILTPATLGERYLEGLEKAGLKTEIRIL